MTATPAPRHPEPAPAHPDLGLIGFYGLDRPGARPRAAVSAGAMVALGQTLWTDRKRPWIRGVSPVAGVVARVAPGARRSLAGVEIRPAGEAALVFDAGQAATRAGLAELMVETGLWTALRARPHGHIPDPADAPEAIFVTATTPRGAGPDPALLLAAGGDHLFAGLTALTRLTPGPVWLCHPAGMTPAVPAGVRARGFPPRRALAGAHVHALHPVAHGGLVWEIDLQEVAALGALLQTGRLHPARRVLLRWPGGQAEAEALPGARLHDLFAGRLGRGAVRYEAGAAGLMAPAAHLPALARQALALPHPDAVGAGSGWSRILRRARPRALIPNAWDAGAAPPGVALAPLLRALAVGDAEAARRAGALGLLEEDLAAMAARHGPDGADWPALLRATLAELEETP